MTLIRFRALTLIYCLLFVMPSAFSQVQKIYLSPKTARGGKQSLLVDSIRIIPLEKRPGISLDDEYIYPIITDDYFIIKPYNNNTIYFFDRQGKFVKQISNKQFKDASIDYDDLRHKITMKSANKNYQLTQRDWLEVSIDFANPKNRKYYKKYELDFDSADAKLNRVEIGPYEVLQANKYFEDYYISGSVQVSDLFKDTLDHELKVYRNNEIVKAYFPFHKREEPRFKYGRSSTGIFSTGTDSIKLIGRSFNDTVYQLRPDTILPIYKLVLPQENALPPSFFTTAFKTKTDRENFEANNGWLLKQLYDFSENKRFIIMGMGFFRNYGRFAYDKQTKYLYDLNKVKTDSSQYDLPILSGNEGQDYKGKRYTSVKLDNMKAAYKKDNNIAWPADVKAIAADKEKYMNIAIVEYMYKTN